MSGPGGSEASGVLDVVSAAASAWGNRPAVTGPAEGYGYVELLAAVHQCAAWIRNAYLGAPLVVVPSSTPTDVVAILAAVVAGVCPLVADQAWTDREIEHVIRSTHAGGILGRREVLPAGLVPAGPPWRGMTIGRWGAPPPATPLALDGIGFGRFTSGTTGGSRCLGFSEQAAVRAAAAWRHSSGLTAADTVLCLATLNNGLAFNTCLLSVFGAGARLVLHAGRPIPSSIARAVQNVRPSVLVAFPFAFEALTSTRKLERGDLRLAVSSAAALAPETQQRWHDLTGLGVCNYYGLVETGPVTFNDARVPSSVGSPLPGAEIVIEPVASGPTAAGRVLVRTSSMASRYLDGRPPGLQQSLTLDGFYRTNDLGFLDSTGHLHLTGRAGAVVNVAGRKIDPSEVATVIRSIPGVSDVVVRGEMTAGGELLAAYVESTSVHRQAIVEHCRHSLAEYKLPQRIIIRAKLPRSSAGKVAAARLTDEPATT
jgi:acyl-CoA synthetase (AMP-forming)/AMP-acid ligase II